MTISDRAKRYFAGIQVSPTRIAVSIFDSSLRLAGKSKRSTKPERGPDAVVERIARAVFDAVDEADLEVSSLTGAGLAVCAAFDPALSAAARSSGSEWNAAAPALQQVLQIPVHPTSLGAASAAGVRAVGDRLKGERVAVIFVEEELAVGMICAGQVQTQLDEAIMGKDRWFDWGAELSGLPGKKRYRKLSSLLTDKNHPALDLFEKFSGQLARVLTRCLDQFKPDTVALVGLGAEELKPELTVALTVTEGLGERLGSINFTVPAFGFNVCQLGAAALAMERLDAKKG